PDQRDRLQKRRQGHAGPDKRAVARPHHDRDHLQAGRHRRENDGRHVRDLRATALVAVNLSRRQLLAGAGAGAAALLLEQSGVQAQTTSNTIVVFSHTTVVTADAVHDDVALAIEGDKIVAIDATDTILKAYRNADVYDGRGKALFPGLINCHA